MSEPASPNLKLGIACAVGVLFIWSGFLVFSRAGVKTSLTAADITGLRFIVAGGLVLPFARRWWPRHLALGPQIALIACGPGIAYSMLMYLGLGQTSAAYAGVFANGTIPLFTLLIAALTATALPGRGQMVGVGIVLAGALLAGLPGLGGQSGSVLLGILFFLASSALVSFYIWALRRWNVKPHQALALVNIPNAVLFLPVWMLFLPSGLAEANLPSILFQALFQGLGPGFLAVILFALAAVHLGPTGTAGFSAAVPATAALLAIPVLDEAPTVVEWAGIGLVTLGLLVLVRARSGG